MQPIIDGEADMVIGDRLSNGTYAKENKRGFHGFGNNLVRNLINTLFNSNIHDVMTAIAKAEISVNVATTATGKVIQAYDKITQIQI